MPVNKYILYYIDLQISPSVNKANPGIFKQNTMKNVLSADSTLHFLNDIFVNILWIYLFTDWLIKENIWELGVL